MKVFGYNIDAINAHVGKYKAYVNLNLNGKKPLAYTMDIDYDDEYVNIIRKADQKVVKQLVLMTGRYKDQTALVMTGGKQYVLDYAAGTLRIGTVTFEAD